jgi:hypothetical protein
MTRTATAGVCREIALISLIMFIHLGAVGQTRMPAGHSVGKVSTLGDLIVVELAEGVRGNENLFNLGGRTLRFTPDGSRFRVENGSLKWDPNFGAEISNGEVSLHNFRFPFSQKNWTSLQVGTTGWISFGSTNGNNNDRNEPHSRGGVSIGRFDPLAEAAGELINRVPAICVFFKPRMSGHVYAKELPDALVITWDTTEPFGNIQDFTWFRTVNLFQAILHRNGTIEMAYKELTAKDAIVGVYPELPGKESVLATLAGGLHPALPPYLDVQAVKVSVVDGVLLRVAFQTRGAIPQVGDPAVKGIGYRLNFASGEMNWIVEGTASEDSPTGQSKYFVFGPGASHKVKIAGNSITIEGILPAGLRKAGELEISADVVTEANTSGPVEHIGPQTIRLSSLHNPEAHFSALTSRDGPFSTVYEAFHYGASPSPTDLACTVIKALGDNFDFLAYYSDFRIDNQEAGTPSDGPVGGNVTGIGQSQHDLDAYCSKGRFQWEYVQPVYVGANQMQEYPPDGALVGPDRDITFYRDQLQESSPDRKMLPYNYAMSQLGHEMGHRWAAFVSAKVNGQRISLGPVHWARGLQAPAAFPYQRPTEASAMGGGVWQDNFDGTYTQLDDDYYVPASAYSHLDLYLMGLISPAEVPDFFLLNNLVPHGKDASSRRVFKAERTKITVQDVIAEQGPRQPDVNHSQRKFNTGMVLVIDHDKTPSRELVERVKGIGSHWIEYWARATGHRASMTVSPE